MAQMKRGEEGESEQKVEIRQSEKENINHQAIKTIARPRQSHEW